VCTGSCGPGNTHLVQGPYDAHRSGEPLLAIAAQIPSGQIGTGFFQETHPERLAPRMLTAGGDLSMVGRFDVLEDTDEQVTLSCPPTTGSSRRRFASTTSRWPCSTR
jgi:hypothetical protein